MGYVYMSMGISTHMCAVYGTLCSKTYNGSLITILEYDLMIPHFAYNGTWQQNVFYLCAFVGSCLAGNVLLTIRQLWEGGGSS